MTNGLAARSVSFLLSNRASCSLRHPDYLRFLSSTGINCIATPESSRFLPSEHRPSSGESSSSSPCVISIGSVVIVSTMQNQNQYQVNDHHRPPAGFPPAQPENPPAPDAMLPRCKKLHSSKKITAKTPITSLFVVLGLLPRDIPARYDTVSAAAAAARYSQSARFGHDHRCNHQAQPPAPLRIRPMKISSRDTAPSASASSVFPFSPVNAPIPCPPAAPHK